MYNTNDVNFYFYMENDPRSHIRSSTESLTIPNDPKRFAGNRMKGKIDVDSPVWLKPFCVYVPPCLLSARISSTFCLILVAHPGLPSRVSFTPPSFRFPYVSPKSHRSEIASSSWRVRVIAKYNIPLAGQALALALRIVGSLTCEFSPRTWRGPDPRVSTDIYVHIRTYRYTHARTLVAQDRACVSTLDVPWGMGRRGGGRDDRALLKHWLVLLSTWDVRVTSE